ncbi:hypothetical protein P171DRAFT_225719 [Karstenula rhodostoma CBS 690.94]|uniref:Secreted protein n=1 Tax=Karstenula rhodostoma CBS 690.94 TaxID=1392251 RepID=A0A9P4PNS2_9PLEO|nr:hypothetical protein P171DRAFT_225719 [Karstenula rhodostoma CBS 690.94]
MASIPKFVAFCFSIAHMVPLAASPVPCLLLQLRERLGWIVRGAGFSQALAGHRASSDGLMGKLSTVASRVEGTDCRAWCWWRWRV